MKTWKRNAIVATVLVLICAGVYLNWSATRDTAVDLTETLNAQQIMPDADVSLVSNMEDPLAAPGENADVADYFAQIRLNRQETRENAVGLLQETLAYEEEGSATAETAAAALDKVVGDALAESQIESLAMAKGYKDCVAYMGDETISVAVCAPAEGLADSDIVLLSDIVTSQTDYDLSDVRIIEVKE